MTTHFARRTTRRTTGVAFSVLAAGAATAALAFACTPSASIALSAREGAPGSTLTVSGQAFLAGAISLSFDGQTVGTTSGPSFSQSITVPQLAPGVYLVLAVGPEAAGSTGPKQVAGTFEVTGPPPSASTGAEATPAPTQQQQAVATPVETQRSTSATAPARAERGATPQRRAERPAAGRERTRAPLATSPARAIADSAVVGTSSGPVFAGSVPTISRRGSADGTAAGPRTTGIPKAAAAASEPRPSLASPAGGLDDGPGSRLGIGIALLALGLVAPLAGFLVADVRRRRARADHGARR